MLTGRLRSSATVSMDSPVETLFIELPTDKVAANRRSKSSCVVACIESQACLSVRDGGGSGSKPRLALPEYQRPKITAAIMGTDKNPIVTGYKTRMDLSDENCVAPFGPVKSFSVSVIEKGVMLRRRQ